MYNQEILDKLVDKYGPELAVGMCAIISSFYDIKYNDCKTRECSEEYDYEREWWYQASLDLKAKEVSNA